MSRAAYKEMERPDVRYRSPMPRMFRASLASYASATGKPQANCKHHWQEIKCNGSITAPITLRILVMSERDGRKLRCTMLSSSGGK
jgi:hypothetical protein